MRTCYALQMQSGRVVVGSSSSSRCARQPSAGHGAREECHRFCIAAVLRTAGEGSCRRPLWRCEQREKSARAHRHSISATASSFHSLDGGDGQDVYDVQPLEAGSNLQGVSGIEVEMEDALLNLLDALETSQSEIERLSTLSAQIEQARHELSVELYETKSELAVLKAEKATYLSQQVTRECDAYQKEVEAGLITAKIEKERELAARMDQEVRLENRVNTVQTELETLQAESRASLCEQTELRLVQEKLQALQMEKERNMALHAEKEAQLQSQLEELTAHFTALKVENMTNLASLARQEVQSEKELNTLKAELDALKAESKKLAQHECDTQLHDVQTQLKALQKEKAKNKARWLGIA